MAAAATPVTVVDDTGAIVTLPGRPQRIASLAPGTTEMLFAAGAGAQVIATVEYSDEPPAARAVPRIGDANAIDLERLIALHPDVVVLWPGGANQAQLAALTRLRLPLYRQQVNRLADLPDSLRRLGALAGTGAAAERAAEDIGARLARVAHRYEGAEQPRVLLQIWDRPIYTVGGTQFMSDALRVCGARNVFEDLGALAPAVDTEAVIARDPDIIIAVGSPGATAEWLADWKRFGSIRAVRTGKLFAFADPRFTRLGPSALDATQALCQLIDGARARR
jgi:iron complex transport system substrate-binding protein